MAGFYRKDLATRRALTKRAVSERTTLVERWESVLEENTKGWADRAQHISLLVRDQDSVADLGCGPMHLERFLRSSVRYLPVDVVRRDARTIVVDLNQEELPRLSASCIVAAGVLEYIHDVPKLLSSISRHFKMAVLTYNISENTPSQETREGHGWVNSFTDSDLEDEFIKARLVLLEKHLYGSQMIWKLESGYHLQQTLGE
jgi:hypothetical protein